MPDRAAAVGRRRDGRRLAGVSSFGFSGTNVHLVVEGPPARRRRRPPADERPLHVLAAVGPQRRRAARAGRALRRPPARAPPAPTLADVAATAGAGRSHFRHRLAVVAAGRRDGGRPARRLRRRRAGARAASTGDVERTRSAEGGLPVHRAGRAVRRHGPRPCTRPSRCSGPPSTGAPTSSTTASSGRCSTCCSPSRARTSARLLDQTGYTQPALVAARVRAGRAVAELGRRRPSAVLGHSVGEYAAAIVAGVLSLEDGLRPRRRARPPDAGPPGRRRDGRHLRAARPRWRRRWPRHGGAVAVAARNGPAHIVVSGRGRRRSTRSSSASPPRGVRTQRLNVSHAFHSPLLDPMLDDLERGRRRRGPAAAPPAPDLEPDRRRRRRRARQARLLAPPRPRGGALRATASQQLARLGCDVFVEIGPHPTPLGMAQAVAARRARALWLPSLRKGRDDWQQLLESLAQLYAAGAAIDWARRRPAPRRGAPWRCRRTRSSASATGSPRRRPARPTRRRGGHPLLGRRLRSALPQAQFEQELSTDSVDFLRDHRVFGTDDPAGHRLRRDGAGRRRRARAAAPCSHDVEILAPLVVGDDEVRDGADDRDARRRRRPTFEILSQAPGTTPWQLPRPWPRRRRRAGARRPSTSTRCGRRRTARSTADEHYDRSRDRGLDFGPSLRGVDAGARGERRGAGRRSALQAEPGPLPCCTRRCSTPRLQTAGVAGRRTTTPRTCRSPSTGSPSPAPRRPGSAWAHASVRSGGAGRRHPDGRRRRSSTTTAGRSPPFAGLRLKRAGRDALLGLGRGPDRRLAVPARLGRRAGTTAPAPRRPRRRPAAVAAAADRRRCERAAEHDLDHYQRPARRRSTQLSGDDVVDALGQLGAPLSRPAHRIDAADLDVAAPHRRLLDRLLAGLADRRRAASRRRRLVGRARRRCRPTTADRWEALAAEHPERPGRDRHHAALRRVAGRRPAR